MPFIEGLAGNYNDNPLDDIVNHYTNQTLSQNATDQEIYNACVSWEINNATKPKPIYEDEFLVWYNNNNTLQNISTNLAPSIVYGLCSNQTLCVHDYLITLDSYISQMSSNSYNNFSILAAQSCN
ncbi:unnamed protein product [Didymodactylos carnosus]|uniref:Uncharacterized protein n=1 Tax=Didymodactylos carnosus TaxID=1234261 RepID=A0A8S2WTD7_9BILA|nr:unnamed protein product [Didymodactylos carnosus]CAF4460940.1 unnamed protein product [Didymodactylos carnosus]